MNTDDEMVPARRTEVAVKKAYAKPRIEDYGTVVDITGSGSGVIDDGAGVFQRSGAAT